MNNGSGTHLSSRRMDRGRVVVVEAGNGSFSQFLGHGLERRGSLQMTQDGSDAGEHSMPQLLHSGRG